ncbi:hypothetical protein GIB67_031225 [Kingdonia uniflora]|uniref:Uncharacterized protein n=1 Tax=Kingdonia uniflora TaxID=39325 RepID=A0A7J7NL20_9MAGN|nr:hypothetical protein GIB67_031225 [Kingdonia uniflora]
MVSAMSPLGATRSSLEEMLDSIRRREERPRDVPPALPVRPVSKARLPSARRTLPVNFKVGDSGPAKELGSHSGEKEVKKRDQKLVKGDEGGGFESRKMSKGDVELLAESPYAKKGERNGYDEVLGKRRNLGCVDASSLVPESVEESEWADSIDYVLKKKLRVWCQLPNGEWESGKIQSNSGEDAILLLSDGKLVTVPTGNLLPANPDVLEGVDDLIQLSYLNEPSVLYNLQYRYSHDMIYTKAGPVLVAINPFKDVHIYGTEFLKGYREKVLDSPHVYAIADTAFSEMMRGE